MKTTKYLFVLLTSALLSGCTFPFGPGDDSTSDPKKGPYIDVDNIDVGELHRDNLTGTIASNSEGTSNYFDIYEVSDFHGAVNYSTEEKTIGITKLGDYFSKKRQENQGGTIVISGGDMYQGSAESNLTHGYYVNYAMNIMGFESMTLGNHEFDWSIDWLRKNQSLSVDDFKIPYLGANVYDKATGQILDFLKPSTVISRGDYKIGVIGTLGDNSEKAIMPALIESLEFKQELPIVKEEAKRLREQEGCNIVIWSSHRDAGQLAGLGLTKEDGINAVFGGHSHRNFPGDGEPTTYVEGIPYLETRNIGRGLAHVRIEIDKASKNVVGAVGDLDASPYQYPGLVDHPEVQKVCDVYNSYIDPIKQQVIGSTDGELEVIDSFSLTDYCVETMAEVAKEWGAQNNINQIVASFHNANGGVRANIKAGDITYGDVYKSFPFDNEVCIIKAKGSKIKDYFYKSSSYGVWRDVTYTSLKDFDDETDYYFTTTDFMATSSSFVFKLTDDDLIRTGYIVRDVIAERIQEGTTIHAADYRRSSNERFQPLKK